MRLRTLPRVMVLGCLASLAGLTISACSTSTASTDASDGLSGTIQVTAIEDLTGGNGYAGVETQQGQEVAVAEINDTHFLGNAKLQLNYKDTATNPQQAAVEATQAVSSSTPILLGPLTSGPAEQISPIVTRGKLPTIYTQASADGVLISPYTYRATMPGAQLLPTIAPYLVSQGVKSISVIYASDNEASVGYATQLVPSFAKANNITMLAAKGTLSTTTDFTAIASSVVSQKPSAIGLFVIGTQYVTVIKELRQDGFKGLIFASSAAGGGILTPAGSLANGVVWPTDYTIDKPGSGPAEFLKLFTKKYPGQTPSNFSAEGYDQVWLAARALKAANSTDRARVLAGLQKVALSGFTGAVGPIKFVNRSEICQSAIVKWENGQETVTG